MKKSIDQPPNVILIISDQWSTKVSDGSGNYDNGILTPGIDLLAKQGLALSKLTLLIHYVPQQGQVFLRDCILNNDAGFNLKKDSILAQSNYLLRKILWEAKSNVAYFGKEHAEAMDTQVPLNWICDTLKWWNVSRGICI